MTSLKNTLLAPNGKPSNLTPEQYKLVRTTEFKAWFGDWENSPETASKVVDDNGEPLVVYHGTGREFYEFDREYLGTKQGKSPHNLFGFYFTDSRAVASSFSRHSLSYSDLDEGSTEYATRKNWAVRPFFLNIRNIGKINLHNKNYGESKDRINDFVRGLKRDKDGIVLMNYTDTMSHNEQTSNQYIIKESIQAKLADGSNTTFDASSPDIRFEAGGASENEIGGINKNAPTGAGANSSLASSHNESKSHPRNEGDANISNLLENKNSNGIRYRKTESQSTDSVYYHFYDNAGREALIRLSDHDANFFRQEADVDLPLNTPLEKIILYGESALLGKAIKIPAFIGDEIAGQIIERIVSSKYGLVVYFKDNSYQLLHQFESAYGVKVKDRTREDEIRKIKNRQLFNQLEESGRYLHYGNEDMEFKPENYPAFVSARYYVKKAIPFSEKAHLDKYKKYFDEIFYVLYISKEKEGKKTPGYTDYYKETYPLVPYLDYLVKNNVLQPADEPLLPIPYREEPLAKSIRLKYEEIERMSKTINHETNGMLRQHGLEDFKKRFSDRFDMQKIEFLLEKKEALQRELKVLHEQEKHAVAETRSAGGVIDGHELRKFDRYDMRDYIIENVSIADAGYELARILYECLNLSGGFWQRVHMSEFGSYYVPESDDNPVGDDLLRRIRISNHRSKYGFSGADIRITDDIEETAENFVQELYDGKSEPIYWERKVKEYVTGGTTEPAQTQPSIFEQFIEKASAKSKYRGEMATRLRDFDVENDMLTKTDYNDLVRYVKDFMPGAQLPDSLRGHMLNRNETINELLYMSPLLKSIGSAIAKVEKLVAKEPEEEIKQWAMDYADRLKAFKPLADKVEQMKARAGVIKVATNVDYQQVQAEAKYQKAYLMPLDVYLAKVAPVLIEFRKWLKQHERYFINLEYGGYALWSYPELVQEKERGAKVDYTFDFTKDDADKVLFSAWNSRGFNKDKAAPQEVIDKKNEYIAKLSALYDAPFVHRMLGDADNAKSNKRAVRYAIDYDVYKRLLQSGEVDIDIIRLAAGSAGVKLPQKVLEFMPHERLTQEKYAALFDKVQPVNKEKLKQLIDDINASIKEFLEQVFTRSKERYLKNIENLRVLPEVTYDEFDSLMPYHGVFMPFSPQPARLEIKEKIVQPKYGKSYTEKETINYYAVPALTEIWEAALDRGIRATIEEMKMPLFSSILANFTHISKPIASVQKLSIEVGYKDFQGEFRFVFADGSKFDYHTQGILAGGEMADKNQGYHIQSLHIRYISDFKNVTLADGSAVPGSLFTIVQHFGEKKMEVGGLFHGSPHKVEQFSTEYMGTGSGAQEQGWGLYFTDSREVAKSYAEMRMSKILSILRKEFPQHDDSWNAIMAFDVDGNEEILRVAEKTIKDKKYLARFKELLIEHPQYLYHITLYKGKPGKQDWLEWKQPLTPAQTKKVIRQMAKENYQGRVQVKKGKLVRVWGGETEITSGQELYRAFAGDMREQKAVSLFLLRAGIDGIRYPDKSGKGTNYVVFDENAVTIDEVQQLEVGGVYHGSTSKFDKFSTSKIDSGTGAQDYGWGIYFTDLKYVAGFYALQAVRKGADIVFAKQKTEKGKHLAATMNGLLNGAGWNIHDTRKYIKEHSGKDARALLLMLDEIEKEKPKSYLYKVTLQKGKPEDAYEWLVWEEDIPEAQIQKIRKRLMLTFGSGAEIQNFNHWIKERKRGGFEVYHWIRELLSRDDDESVKYAARQKRASRFLLLAGIDGVKYEGARPGHFNYVVFDADAVTIDKVTEMKKGGQAGYMKLQRTQHRPVTDVWDFNYGSGQHGDGIYAFKYGDKAMQEYYTRNGETLYTFEVPERYVFDASDKNYDFWEAKTLIYNHPEYKAFIFNHRGIGIPTSKEVVITEAEIIQNITHDSSSLIGKGDGGIIAYHGSQNPDIQFRDSSIAYFTDAKNTAEAFADRSFMGESLLPGEIPTLYTVKLKYTNPKVFTTENEYKAYFEDTAGWQKIKEQGHDAMIYQPADGGDNYYAVFSPSQIEIVKKEFLKKGGQSGINIENLIQSVHSDAAYAILDTSKESSGSTWTQGACGLFASALQQVVGGELYAVVTKERGVEHIILKVGDKYYDADGEHLLNYFFDEYPDLEDIAYKVEVKPLSEVPADKRGACGLKSGRQIKELADFLRKQSGQQSGQSVAIH